MNKLLFAIIISAKALSLPKNYGNSKNSQNPRNSKYSSKYSSKYFKFQFRDIGFNDMNMIIDESLLKDTDEYCSAKKYMVRNVENKYIRYISLFNITSNITQNDPLIFVFIKIVPVIQTMSIEFILLPTGKYSSQEIKNLTYITYQHLKHLCEITGLKLDIHYLKYNGNDKWFLEFTMCQT